MTERKPPQTAQDVLRMLHEFLFGEEQDFRVMPIEKVQEYLREARIEPEPTIEAIRKRIAKSKGAQALRTAREQRLKRQRELSAGQEKRQDLGTLNRERLLAKLRELVGPAQAVVYMRHYENLDDDDLRSLVEDIEALGDHDASGK